MAPETRAQGDHQLVVARRVGGRPHHRIGDRYQDVKEMGGEVDNPAGV